MKVLKIINIFLSFGIIVLLINLSSSLITGNELVETIYGGVAYNTDQSEQKCYFNNTEILNIVPIDRCCSELQKLLICKPIINEEFDFKCFTAENSVNYLINKKTLYFCKLEGYDVKVE